MTNMGRIQSLIEGQHRDIDVDFGILLPTLNIPNVNLNYYQTFKWSSRF